MKKNMRVFKSLSLIVVLVLALAAFMHAAQPVQAAGVCPAPGTGIAGALNMIHDAKMLEIMIAHVPQQGWDGMGRAVDNTSCQ